MLIESASPTRILVSRREGLRSPIFIGIGFLVFAAMPWFTPQVTLGRVVASVIFAIVAVAMLFRGRPRKVERVLDLERKTLIDGSSERSWSESESELVLAGGESETSEDLVPRYRAELVLGPNERVVVLEHRSPSKVLCDACRLTELLQVPLQPGWGLDRVRLDHLVRASSAAPRDAASSATTSLARTLDVLPHPVQRDVTTAVALGGFGITLVMALLFAARAERGEAIAPISVGVSLLLVLCLVLVALALKTLKLRVHANSSIKVFRHFFGTTRLELALDRTGLRAADCVSPTGTEPLHVVLSTEAGLVCFAAPGAQAARVLELLNAGDH